MVVLATLVHWLLVNFRICQPTAQTLALWGSRPCAKNHWHMVAHHAMWICHLDDPSPDGHQISCDLTGKNKNLKIVHKAEAAWTPWTCLQFLIDLHRVPELLQLRPCDQCVDTKIRHARPVSSKQNNEGDPPSHHPSEGSHSRFFALDLCEKSVAGSNLNCMSKETLQHRLWPLQKQPGIPGMAIHVPWLRLLAPSTESL